MSTVEYLCGPKTVIVYVVILYKLLIQFNNNIDTGYTWNMRFKVMF